MKIDDENSELTIERMTQSWSSQGIRANPEYQRGIAWTKHQRAMLVDSVLRGYPLPRFYFQKKSATDPFGNQSVVLEVIDGQQRLIALSNYRADHWALFDPKDPKVHLPAAIRRLPCPWAGRTFSALPDDLKQRFLTTKLPCVVIEQFDTPEEVRDIFIRLQAGTALTRQQVRDAWPGNVGPFVESLAGKMSREPQFKLFGAVDKRGSGSAENSDVEDRFHDNRQTCAQLLWLFLGRRSPGGQIPSVSAASLDDLYYTHTDLKSTGAEAREFTELLQDLEIVIEGRPRTMNGKRMKLTKRELFALALTLQDLRESGRVAMRDAVKELARVAWTGEAAEDLPANMGKQVSASAISAYYDWYVRATNAERKVHGTRSETPIRCETAGRDLGSSLRGVRHLPSTASRGRRGGI
jgi:hypothetical protein